MRGVLVDTGPLVAVVDESDIHHERCAEALKHIHAPLFTVWPVVSEAMHLLRSAGWQAKLWEALDIGGIEFLTLDRSDIPHLRALMTKYADLPMDLADAALVHVAARDGIHTVFTIDRTDFVIYRLPGGRRLRLLP